MKPECCPYCNSPRSVGSTTRHWWFSCGTYLKRLDCKTVQMTDLCAERQQLTAAIQLTEQLRANVDFLQARLIERTEQSTLTAYRDAEIIRQLREALRESRRVGLYPGS